MNNQQFLEVLKNSFVKFLETHSRSNEKLKYCMAVLPMIYQND